MLRQLIFISREANPFTEEQLRRLFAHARVANPRRRITGLVAYYRKGFFQVMEGDENTLTELFDIILQDARHHIVFATMLPIAHRYYEGWTMAVPDYHPSEGRADDGLIPITTLTYDDALLNGKARKMFREFEAGQWSTQAALTAVC